MGVRPHPSRRTREPREEQAPQARTRATLLFILAILFVFPLASPHAALASTAALQEESAGEESLSTRYFTIYYPEGEEKTARWYAEFADEVDTAVSELLGAEPVEGLTLRIYASEPDYMRANPMAELHPGILAHAIPEQLEIGVAVERLRQQPPQLARESFRHEITHIVAGVLSDHNLPVGFHEGLGQYNELSEHRSKEVRDLIAQAQAEGKPLLPWVDLMDMRTFRRNIEIAYPQSYTVMAFLAERYGMEPFAGFIAGLREGREYGHAILVSYGKRVDDLEKEWRDYLPSFLDSGWQHNVLSAHDLSHGMALMSAGRFTEAEEALAESERLYRDLGRADRVTEAEEALGKARAARQADEATGEARKSLEGHDYAAGFEKADEAARSFTELNLPDHARRASDIALMAQQGLAALRDLEGARDSLRSFNLPASYTQARQAGEALAALGDATRVAEANAILSDLHTWQQAGGYGALGLGALVVGGGGAALFAANRRRARREAGLMAAAREEQPSWM